jgi:hypothetical protein
MAIATRFLLGALNGLLGPIKAYAIEVCRPEHEALALSLVKYMPYCSVINFFLFKLC